MQYSLYLSELLTQNILLMVLKMLLMDCYWLKYLAQVKLIQVLVQWVIKSLCLGHERQEKPHTILIILQFSRLLILRGWWIIAAHEEIEEYWYLQFRDSCLFKQNWRDNQIIQQQTLGCSILNFVEGSSFRLQQGSLTSICLIHYSSVSIFPFLLFLGKVCLAFCT